MNNFKSLWFFYIHNFTNLNILEIHHLKYFFLMLIGILVELHDIHFVENNYHITLRIFYLRKRNSLQIITNLLFDTIESWVYCTPWFKNFIIIGKNSIILYIMYTLIFPVRYCLRKSIVMYLIFLIKRSVYNGQKVK